MTNRKHFQLFPFHLVDQSPWPILTSFSLFLMAISAVMCFHGFEYGGTLLLLGFILTLSVMILWFKDVATEGAYLGDHTTQVRRGLTIGFVLFVVSEVFAFLSIFWAFFHSSLSPDISLGNTWPPYGIVALDPFAIPLLNTVLLLSSGEEIRHIWECYFNILSNINIKLEYTFLQSINLFPLIPSFVKHLPSRKNKCQ